MPQKRIRVSLYDPLYHQKRAAKLADAKLAAQDALLRKPSPTAVTRFVCHRVRAQQDPDGCPPACDNNCLGDCAIGRAVKRATDDSVDTNARRDGRATTDGKQPHLDHRRAASHTGDERRDCSVNAASTTTTEAILGQLRSEVATLRAQVVDLQASLDARLMRLFQAGFQSLDVGVMLRLGCSAMRNDIPRGSKLLQTKLEDAQEAASAGASELVVARGFGRRLAARRRHSADFDDDIEVILGDPPAPPDLVAAAELEAERKAYEALEAQADDAATRAASNELRLENKILKLMTNINDLSAGVNALSSDKSELAEAKTKLQEETAGLLARVAALETALQTQETNAMTDMTALETRAVTA
ncbi:hypothetical protein SDRG_01367 [Saprolegnia diclina VS20]|uniref:Uncharacterized protein n=1 Tax=Saprolegnia diclina (strain VS20) TaxID=1156394 RepID=T0R356_SAPDV|nr:hypothetical protein SDRG_01367 [Saprolegnia diclina VS20]EQC41396.1 hypothetical protein SDRG_01367 [Saprolegnia diclina VS20]|eukprot:XP_008605110.1 hypothetical protein SDRG_01367 [Saprolegnia diclina VS20]